MVSTVDQQRVCALLTEAVTVICKNGLTFNNKFCIEGLLGITLDDRNMFLVNIKESILKGGANTANQNRSESMSKAGVFVGTPPMQSNGGRGQMGMGQPRGGMTTAQQQMMRRRPGGPQTQVIPAKRPMPGQPGQPGMAGGPGQVGPGRGGGGPGRGGGPQQGIPQEWAALIKLQSQHPGHPPSNRGRGRGTARRASFSRVQHRAPMGSGPGQGVKSPPRRLSQSGVELESREELERKAAEQAKSRSERLQRRKAMSGGAPPAAGDDQAGKGGGAGDGGAALGDTPEKGAAGDSEAKKPADPDGDVKKAEPEPEKSDPSDKETPPTTEDKQETNTESTEASDKVPVKSEPAEKKPQQTKENDGVNQDKAGEKKSEGKESGEGADEGARQEGDGSWLLSNSSWLLGDLESMASNSSWKDSAQDSGTSAGSKDKPHDGDP